VISEKSKEGYNRVLELVRGTVKELARIAAEVDPDNFERVLDKTILMFVKLVLDVYVDAMGSMKAAKERKES